MTATATVVPIRGAQVKFTLKNNGTAAGTVTSTYTAGGKRRLTIRTAAGIKFTRTADSVTVTRAGPAETGPIQPRAFGQTPGMPAPNAGRKFPAEPLAPEEVAAILDQCSRRAPTGIRNRALLLLLVRSGLRIAELIALRPSDVNWAEHSLRLLDTKIGEAQTRAFHSSVDDALMRWIDTRARLGYRSGPLFCTLKGDPVSGDYVRVLLRRLKEQAGIEKRVHPHGMRHTFACELRAAGVDILTISKLLGHSSVTTTLIYLDHLTNGQAVAALGNVELPPL
jgi:site-specific recombinase XerD